MWNKGWDDLFAGQTWGRYPPLELVRFVARNFGAVTDRRDVQILEVGCGPGANLWFLAREGFRVYGLDGSAIALEQARTRLTSEDLDAEYTHGDAMNMPFEADQFDAVIDIECLYANTKSDTLEIIDEIHRVLRPGGLLFSVTYMTGLPGDGERVEGEPNTYATLAAGPLHEGYGVVRMTGEEEISEIYGRFDSIAYDTLVRTDSDRTTEIREWLITATKGQDNER